MDPELNLYMVEYDNDQTYVEAAAMGRAIEIWRQHKAAMGGGWDGTEEPDQVALIHQDAVVREPDDLTALRKAAADGARWERRCRDAESRLAALRDLEARAAQVG